MRVVLADILESEGHLTTVSPDGGTGLQTALEDPPDLLLLDVMLPKLDGFTICETLRNKGLHFPILMLTAKGAVDDRVEGLNCGADDYLTKPFSERELIARVQALLRRAQLNSAPTERVDPIEFGGLIIDLENREALVNETAVPFTHKEFEVLQLLWDAEGKPISRETFLNAVWGYDAYPTTRTVDTHIATIRHKIHAAGGDATHLQTVHGIGYRLIRTKTTQSFPGSEGG